ncbi:hypothetical protein [Pedobacter sp. BMA]|uniref:hypothetical protein n=1 Tax=Pedobacter sp. BMA TaxID=1663685 RepID=UPI000649ECDA|nr:hypothetical protein [Pedobacter sp. BMA]KLT66477.1 hypothetical protein AB669_04615 [Pedobacter sp. BMA]
MKQAETPYELYLHIPNTVKITIDKVFSENTQEHRNKIYFLVWKINRETKIQINIRNYSNLLGINSGILTKILSSLRIALILDTDGKYCIGRVSNSYFLVKPYGKKCDKESDFQLFYNSTNMDVPKWVKKYCTDKGIVKSKKYSDFGKRPQNGFDHPLYPMMGNSQLLINVDSELMVGFTSALSHDQSNPYVGDEIDEVSSLTQSTAEHDCQMPVENGKIITFGNKQYMVMSNSGYFNNLLEHLSSNAIGEIISEFLIGGSSNRHEILDFSYSMIWHMEEKQYKVTIHPDSQ